MNFDEEIKFLENELRAFKVAIPRSLSRIGTVETGYELSMESGTTYQLKITPVGVYTPLVSYYIDATSAPSGFSASVDSEMVYSFRQTSGTTVSLPIVFVSTSNISVEAV